VAAASLTNLLSTFSSEWEALMLETHALRTALQTTRQELSQALYQHDAACRVIARLIRERDGARAALSAAQAAMAARLPPPGAAAAPAPPSAATPAASTAPATAPDGDVVMSGAGGGGGGGLPESIQSALKDKHKELSRPRKKRVVSSATAGAAAVAALAEVHSYTPHAAAKPGICALAAAPGGDAADGALVLTGGVDGAMLLFDGGAGRVVARCEGGHTKRVTGVAFHATRDALLSASADATVKLWVGANAGSGGGSARSSEYGVAAELRAHSKEVAAVAAHPLGDYALSFGRDATVGFHDLAAARTLSVMAADGGAGHPSSAVCCIRTAYWRWAAAPTPWCVCGTCGRASRWRRWRATPAACAL